MISSRKVSVRTGLALIISSMTIGIFLLIFSAIFTRSLPYGYFLQVISFLSGTLIFWFFSHPLSHYLSAKAAAVSTLYFYMGHSELRNSNIAFVREFASHLTTIGTKLDKDDLGSVSKGTRAFILGSGAIVSTFVSSLNSLIALVIHLNFFTIVVTFVFFLFVLANEIFLSTNSGDLAKAKRALAGF